MTENLNKQKSSISAPPEPGITIRTLESDIEDIERGGGEMIARQPVSFEKDPPGILRKQKLRRILTFQGIPVRKKRFFLRPAPFPRSRSRSRIKKRINGN